MMYDWLENLSSRDLPEGFKIEEELRSLDELKELCAGSPMCLTTEAYSYLLTNKEGYAEVESLLEEYMDTQYKSESAHEEFLEFMNRDGAGYIKIAPIEKIFELWVTARKEHMRVLFKTINLYALEEIEHRILFLTGEEGNENSTIILATKQGATLSITTTKNCDKGLYVGLVASEVAPIYLPVIPLDANLNRIDIEAILKVWQVCFKCPTSEFSRLLEIIGADTLDEERARIEYKIYQQVYSHIRANYIVPYCQAMMQMAEGNPEVIRSLIQLQELTPAQAWLSLYSLVPRYLHNVSRVNESILGLSVTSLQSLMRMSKLIAYGEISDNPVSGVKLTNCCMEAGQVTEASFLVKAPGKYFDYMEHSLKGLGLQETLIEMERIMLLSMEFISQIAEAEGGI